MENQRIKEKRKYSVPALENAFAILKLLSRKRFRESTVTEIANALSLNPATCYRILQSMEEMAAVRYLEEKKRYTLGPYLVVLGERAKEHLDYISVAMPYLDSLTAETGMTSILVNKIGADKLAIVAKAEARDFGVSVSVGRHFSVADGSFGMCFLAYAEPEEQDRMLKGQGSLPGNGNYLKRETEKLRREGYYITYGDFMKGLCGIAAPVFTAPGKVELSIELIGFTSQYERDELDAKGKSIKRAAQEISRTLSRF